MNDTLFWIGIGYVIAACIGARLWGWFIHEGMHDLEEEPETRVRS